MIIKTKEVALLLGVSPQQVRKYVREGTLTNVKGKSRNTKNNAKLQHIGIDVTEIECKFNVKYEPMKILGAYPRVSVSMAARLNGVSSDFFRNHAEDFGFTNIKKIGGRYFAEHVKKEEVIDTDLAEATRKRKR